MLASQLRRYQVRRPLIITDANIAGTEVAAAWLEQLPTESRDRKAVGTVLGCELLCSRTRPRFRQPLGGKPWRLPLPSKAAYGVQS
mgnify:CR=1 FL=1